MSAWYCVLCGAERNLEDFGKTPCACGGHAVMTGVACDACGGRAEGCAVCEHTGTQRPTAVRVPE